jgi:hypothetical protein
LLRRYLIVALLTAWAGLGLSAAAFAGGPVFPRGMRIGLEPAGNLTASTRFPGFEDTERRVMVGILDMPSAAYSDIARSAFDKSPKGMEAVTREAFPFASGFGILLQGHAQDNNGKPVHRWFLVAGTGPGATQSLAMLIRVEVPDTARDVYTDAVVRKMLASVTFRKVPTEELLALLPFKLTDLAGFRVSRVLPAGVVMTDSASDAIANQPYAVITVGRGSPSTASERMRLARDMLVSAPVKDLSVTSADNIRINGWPGNELRAKGATAGNLPITLVQWLRFGATGYLRIVAVAPTKNWDAVFNRFRALRDGIDPR